MCDGSCVTCQTCLLEHGAITRRSEYVTGCTGRSGVYCFISSPCIMRWICRSGIRIVVHSPGKGQ